MTSNSALQLALFGGPLDTGNLGVSALGTSLLEGVHDRAPDAAITVFDHGLGVRAGSVTSAGRTIEYKSLGARLSRRLHRPEAFHTMNAMVPLRGIGNPGIRALREADAVLDVSGGDSFTDMYGDKRFRSIEYPKRIALRMNRPLVLLPQTFGPFRSDSTIESATAIVRGASQVWARDEHSFERLTDMVGDRFDPTKHHLGVDMAFGLRPSEPDTQIDDDLSQWISGDDGPLAGVNISGLLWGSAPAGTTRDELALDYRSLMIDLVRRLIAAGARVLLVPHVVGKSAESASDELAAIEMLAELVQTSDRVRIIPVEGLTAGGAKWWISKCDWFCGARMHATIAALSSGVPTGAVAYSIKTGPVFATAGVEDQVVDGMTASTVEALDHLWSCWLERDAVRVRLHDTIGAVKQSAADQMATIVDSCISLAGQR